MTLDAAHQTAETTGFSQDTTERVDMPFPIRTMDPSQKFDGLSGFNRDSVLQFLKTPVNIRTVNVLSSATRNTTIATIKLPFDTANLGNGTDSGQGMWLQRLNAYQAFKATAVLKFQININRFAQGRVLAHYIPGQNDVADEVDSHRFNLQTKSQTPNVQINLNRDTSSEFRIPYVSAWPAYDLTRSSGSKALTTTNGQMGVLYLVIYSPLVGPTTVPLNVWLHFEDIELFNPTYAPQAGNVTDGETNSGAISGPLRTASKVAGALELIPSLTSFAGTAKWFLEASAKAARAFGWSKPDSEGSLMRVVNQQNTYTMNSDGETAGYKFGVSCRNKLDILPGFAGNDIDEMSLEYICNRSAYLTAFSWATSATQGTDLWTFSNSATNYATLSTIDGRAIYSYIPAGFVANYFTYYRWDAVVIIKVVKTEFHTGKLLISYRPGYNASNLPTSSQETYLPREVLDLKESDTFVIKIPYVSITPWAKFNDVLGCIRLSVFNPLNAPTSVSSSVDVIIELAAENVNFAGISNSRLTPAFGNVASFVPQAGGDPEMTREKVIVLGNLKQTGVELHANRYTVGECIKSVKQLLSRFVQLDSANLTGAGTTKSIILDPFTLGGCYDTATVWSDNPLGGDYLSAIASCFVFMRGSVRILFNPSAGNDYRMSVSTDPVAFVSYPPYTVSTANQQYSNATVQVQKGPGAGTMLAIVSQWGITHSRECGTDFVNGSRVPAFGGALTKLIITATNAFTPATDMTISRSVSDDFQLGFFIGIPPMYFENGVIT